MLKICSCLLGAYKSRDGKRCVKQMQDIKGTGTQIKTSWLNSKRIWILLEGFVPMIIFKVRFLLTIYIILWLRD